MATEKTLQTRIVLKHDTLANWQSDAGKAVVLKEGEVGLVKIVTQKTDEWGNIEKVPSYLMKVGDGTTTFENLNWLQACAADVHSWAKKTEAEFTQWVKGLIDVGDIDLKDYVTTTTFDTYKTQMTEVLAGKQAVGDYATKTEAQDYADAKDTAIAEAKKAGTDAQAAVNALTAAEGAITKNTTAINTLASEIKNGTTIDSFADVETALAGKQDKGDYATKAEAKGYANAKDDAIAEAKQAGTDAQAAVDALTAENGAVTKNATDIAAIQTNISDNYATKQYADDSETDAVAAAKEYTDDEVEKLQNQINTIINNPDAEGAINSINEFTQYITTHGQVAEGFRQSIADNKTAIESNDTEIAALQEKVGNETVAKQIQDAITDADLGKYATTEALNGVSQTVSDMDAAYKLADTNIGKRIDGIDTEIDALQTASHTHTNEAELNKIADGDKAKWDKAATDAVHTNRDVLDGITSTKVAAWDAAEQNAKDYADGLADNYDAKGAAAGVQTKLDELNTSLAPIAKSGNVNDLVQTSGDVLVFDCGTSTVNV